MSLIKPSDVREWLQLGAGSIFVLVVASLAYVYASAFIAERAKRDAAALTQPRTEVGRSPSDSNAVTETDVRSMTLDDWFRQHNGG